MRLTLAASASADLGRIHLHIARDSPQSAARVITRIRAAASNLREFPLVGRPGSDPGTRKLVVRALPYIIV